MGQLPPYLVKKPATPSTPSQTQSAPSTSQLVQVVPTSIMGSGPEQIVQAGNSTEKLSQDQVRNLWEEIEKRHSVAAQREEDALKDAVREGFPWGVALVGMFIAILFVIQLTLIPVSTTSVGVIVIIAIVATMAYAAYRFTHPNKIRVEKQAIWDRHAFSAFQELSQRVSLAGLTVTQIVQGTDPVIRMYDAQTRAVSIIAQNELALHAISNNPRAARAAYTQRYVYGAPPP